MQNDNTAPEKGAIPAYLDKRQVADLFGVKPRCIETWMAKGLIPYYKIGRVVRFNPDTIKAHLDNKCAAGASVNN